MNTVLLSMAVTLAALIILGFSGVFLTRNTFRGKSFIVSMLTFPLAFPGVVVGFMIILLVGRQGLIGDITKVLTGGKVVFAYSLIGLFLGYLYFSIPRVIITIMAAAEKLDPNLEEAARSLGASPFLVIKDVLIPALVPGLISSGAICFATSWEPLAQPLPWPQTSMSAGRGSTAVNKSPRRALCRHAVMSPLVVIPRARQTLWDAQKFPWLSARGTGA